MKGYFIRITSMILFVFTMVVSPVLADGGFAVSGNFSNYHYKMVPGETISTPDVYALFFNEYAVDIEVELSLTLTHLDGSVSTMANDVAFILEKTLVLIPAGSFLKVPIGITLTEDATGGEYLIGLSAEVIPSFEEGIAVRGSVRLRTTLSVYGEAGDLIIKTFDMFDSLFEVSLTVYRQEEGSLSPVASSQDGTILDRVIPGEYLVIALFKNEEVAHKTFTIINDEITHIDLTAKTIFIENSRVTPFISNTTGYLSYIQIDYTLRNIHTQAEDLVIHLNTSFNDKNPTNTEENKLPFLPESTVDLSFNWIPIDGFESGFYDFQLELIYGNNENESIDIGLGNLFEIYIPLEAIQNSSSVPISPDLEDNRFPWGIFSLVGGLLIISITGIVYYRTTKSPN